MKVDKVILNSIRKRNCKEVAKKVFERSSEGENVPARYESMNNRMYIYFT